MQQTVESIDFGILSSELAILDDYIKAFSPLGKYEGDPAYLQTYKTLVADYRQVTGRDWPGLEKHLKRVNETK
jgi:hypothetical protein